MATSARSLRPAGHVVTMTTSRSANALPSVDVGLRPAATSRTQPSIRPGVRVVQLSTSRSASAINVPPSNRDGSKTERSRSRSLAPSASSPELGARRGGTADDGSPQRERFGGLNRQHSRRAKVPPPAPSVTMVKNLLAGHCLTAPLMKRLKDDFEEARHLAREDESYKKLFLKNNDPNDVSRVARARTNFDDLMGPDPFSSRRDPYLDSKILAELPNVKIREKAVKKFAEQYKAQFGFGKQAILYDGGCGFGSGERGLGGSFASTLPFGSISGPSLIQKPEPRIRHAYEPPTVAFGRTLPKPEGPPATRSFKGLKGLVKQATGTDHETVIHGAVNKAAIGAAVAAAGAQKKGTMAAATARQKAQRARDSAEATRSAAMQMLQSIHGITLDGNVNAGLVSNTGHVMPVTVGLSEEALRAAEAVNKLRAPQPPVVLPDGAELGDGIYRAA